MFMPSVIHQSLVAFDWLFPLGGAKGFITNFSYNFGIQHTVWKLTLMSSQNSSTVDKCLYKVYVIRMYSLYTVHPPHESLEHVAATQVAT